MISYVPPFIMSRHDIIQTVVRASFSGTIFVLLWLFSGQVLLLRAVDLTALRDRVVVRTYVRSLQAVGVLR